MTDLDKLEWALMTLRDKLKFGMDEEQAVYRRETRVKGVLADVVRSIKKQQKDLLTPKELQELIYLVGNKTGESDFEHQDQDRQDFLKNLEEKLQKIPTFVEAVED